MPCRCEVYPGPGEETQNMVDKLTRVACDMRTVLRRAELEQEVTEETRAWIREHDDWDTRRIKQERERIERAATRLAALNKLTLEERRVLGL